MGNRMARSPEAERGGNCQLHLPVSRIGLCGHMTCFRWNTETTVRVHNTHLVHNTANLMGNLPRETINAFAWVLDRARMGTCWCDDHQLVPNISDDWPLLLQPFRHHWIQLAKIY